jgi:transcriptional regulator with XRE-family HTH domain
MKITTFHQEPIKMSAKTGPHATSTLATFIDRRMLELRHKKTQRDIAFEAGFTNPNMLTMIKKGNSKLALDRVATMAASLEVDPKYLLRITLEQYGNETVLQVFDDVIGTVVSKKEVGWLTLLREASDNSDPAVTTRARATILSIFGK